MQKKNKISIEMQLAAIKEKAADLQLPELQESQIFEDRGISGAKLEGLTRRTKRAAGTLDNPSGTVFALQHIDGLSIRSAEPRRGNHAQDYGSFGK